MFIVFQPGFEFSTLKNPKNDTPLAFIVRCSGKWFLTSIWPPFVPEMTSIWPCLSENGYLVTLECSIIPNHPRMLDFKGPRKHLWFWRSWRSNGGQNEVGSIRRWHIRKIWAKIELCAKKTPNRLKTVTANPHPPLKCSRWNAPFARHIVSGATALERERESRNPIRARQLCSGDFVIRRSSSCTYIERYA